MPRFYFDFDNSGSFVDGDGEEFHGIDVARREALAALADAAKEHVSQYGDGCLTIRVRDMKAAILDVSATFETKTIR